MKLKNLIKHCIPGRFKRLVSPYLRLEEYWADEFIIVLFNRRTNFKWLPPGTWFSLGWILSVRKSYHGDYHDQTLYGFRCLGWDYSFSTFHEPFKRD